MPFSNYYHSYPYNKDQKSVGYNGPIMPKINGERVSEIKDNTDKRDIVRASIEAIIATNKYERVMNPNIGCKLKDILFEPMDDFLLDDVKQTLKNALNQEPRIIVDDIDIQLNYDTLTINLCINYRFRDTYTADTYNFGIQY